MSLFLLTILLIVISSCQQRADTLSVIPMPQQVEFIAGSICIDEPLQLHIDAPEPDYTILHNYLWASNLNLQKNCMLTSMPQSSSAINVVSDSSYLRMRVGEKAPLILTLEQVDTLPNISKSEGYILNINHCGITIQSTSGAGLFYGVQTLLQLHATNSVIPMCTITDEPRFAYRGVMIDVSRHFFPVEFIKKQIDAMAYYKLNHLHLHLTDAAGWRLEIKRYPKLTQLAAWRTHATWDEWWNADRHYVEENSDQAYGGYYTQDQIRDLVSYAQEHYIAIIPEIEMPSHSEEVLAVYPELSCSQIPYKESDFCIGNEATFEFLENVLAEVITIFPSQYIHIGGDEANKQSWKTCTQCQTLMKSEGFTHVDELQSYFIHRIERYLNAHGRQLIGWDEILEGGLAPSATVMSWRGTEGGVQAIATGHRAIMTPGEFCYFDAYQDAPHTQPVAFGGYLPLKKVYSYDPVPDTLDASLHSLLYGVQANLFSEYIPTQSHMEYMMYPRVLALAEIAWTNPDIKNYDNFRNRTIEAVSHLRNAGYNTFDPNDEVGNRPGSEEHVFHLAMGKKVNYVNGSTYYPSYSAGGDSALVDGLHGGWSYGDHRWQGFLGRNGVDVIIDLGNIQTIHSVSADFMQICGPGVFMPSEVIISVSEDSQSYTELTHLYNNVFRDDSVSFKTFNWNGYTQARYIRYQGKRSQYGGFLFVDEIIVK